MRSIHTLSIYDLISSSSPSGKQSFYDGSILQSKISCITIDALKNCVKSFQMENLSCSIGQDLLFQIASEHLILDARNTLTLKLCIPRSHNCFLHVCRVGFYKTTLLLVYFQQIARILRIKCVFFYLCETKLENAYIIPSASMQHHAAILLCQSQRIILL